jgi:hypothetical protein
MEWFRSGVKPLDWHSDADLWHNTQVAQARPPGCAFGQRTGPETMPRFRSETGAPITIPGTKVS